ncbi:MAG: hypothetical protein M1298_01190 [Chloroflexi bacterium]|nr:hypothetical protein [Chloroflexota bacterium]
MALQSPRLGVSLLAIFLALVNGTLLLLQLHFAILAVAWLVALGAIIVGLWQSRYFPFYTGLALLTVLWILAFIGSGYSLNLIALPGGLTLWGSAELGEWAISLTWIRSVDSHLHTQRWLMGLAIAGVASVIELALVAFALLPIANTLLLEVAGVLAGGSLVGLVAALLARIDFEQTG